MTNSDQDNNGFIRDFVQDDTRQFLEDNGLQARNTSTVKNQGAPAGFFEGLKDVLGLSDSQVGLETADSSKLRPETTSSRPHTEFAAQIQEAVILPQRNRPSSEILGLNSNNDGFARKKPINQNPVVKSQKSEELLPDLTSKTPDSAAIVSALNSSRPEVKKENVNAEAQLPETESIADQIGTIIDQKTADAINKISGDSVVEDLNKVSIPSVPAQAPQRPLTTREPARIVDNTSDSVKQFEKDLAIAEEVRFGKPVSSAQVIGSLIQTTAQPSTVRPTTNQPTTAQPTTTQSTPTESQQKNYDYVTPLTSHNTQQAEISRPLVSDVPVATQIKQKDKAQRSVNVEDTQEKDELTTEKLEGENNTPDERTTPDRKRIAKIYSAPAGFSSNSGNNGNRTPQNNQSASKFEGGGSQEEQQDQNQGTPQNNSQQSPQRDPMLQPQSEQRREYEDYTQEEEDEDPEKTEDDKPGPDKSNKNNPVKDFARKSFAKRTLGRAGRFLGAIFGPKKLLLIIPIVLILVILLFVIIDSPSKQAAIQKVTEDANGAAGATNRDFFEIFEVSGAEPTFKVDDPRVGNIESFKFVFEVKVKPKAEYNKFFGRTDEVNLNKIKLTAVLNDMPPRFKFKVEPNNSTLMNSVEEKDNSKAITWTPNICENNNCKTDLYTLELTYTPIPDDPADKLTLQELGEFQIILGGKVDYTISGVSSNEEDITPAYILCVDASQSTNAATAQSKCSLSLNNGGSGGNGGGNDPSLTLGKDYMCPVEVDQSQGQYIKKRRGYSLSNPEHKGADLAPESESEPGRTIVTNSIRAPIAGVVQYIENADNVDYCGDAILIQVCNKWDNDTSPTRCLDLANESYYVGHFKADGSRFAVGEIVKQKQKLGTYFNQIQNNCGDGTSTCNMGVGGSLRGVMCWTGPHTHLDHRIGLNYNDSQQDIDTIIDNKCSPLK